MRMNFAEGFRRMAHVAGVMTTLGVLAAGLSSIPSQEGVNTSHVYDVTTAQGVAAAREQGRLEPFYGHQIRDTWYKDWADSAVLTSACDAPKHAEVMRACELYKAETAGLKGAAIWHIVKTLGGAIAGYWFWLLLCALLTWIGRGFMQHPPGQPPNA